MKLTRDFYVPSGYTLYAKDERYGFEVYASTGAQRLCAMAFGGKRSKPDWHYSFRDQARLDTKVAETLAGFMAWQDRKAKEKAQRLAPHDVKVGDLFRCSWGYDQTNIDYYECTAVSGQMIELTPIAQESEETGFMQGECVPLPGAYIGKPMRKKVSMAGGEPAVRIYSFASAYRMKPVAKIADKPLYEASRWTAYA